MSRVNLPSDNSNNKDVGVHKVDIVDSALPGQEVKLPNQLPPIRVSTYEGSPEKELPGTDG